MGKDHEPRSKPLSLRDLGVQEGDFVINTDNYEGPYSTVHKVVGVPGEDTAAYVTVPVAFDESKDGLGEFKLGDDPVLVNVPPGLPKFKEKLTETEAEQLLRQKAGR